LRSPPPLPPLPPRLLRRSSDTGKGIDVDDDDADDDDNDDDILADVGPLNTAAQLESAAADVAVVLEAAGATVCGV
jgi:hypothetical protein